MEQREQRGRRDGAAPQQENEFDERLVFINRCSKVVKGGRRFSFSAVVVVGDREGRVGFGFGKANEVSEAIPHEVTGVSDGGRVLLKPAPDGSGVICGGGMRPVLEAAGVRDVVGKSLGSKNRLNVVKATIEALKKLRSAEELAAERA